MVILCTEILQAGSSAAIAALAFQHRDNQNAFIAEGVVKLVHQLMLCLLWPPCIADADIIFFPCGFFMVALCNRADHYIFAL